MPLQKVEELVDSVKKARGLKTKDRNKDKLSEEERDARKDRKLGRKRDRAEDSNSGDHKRRREGKWSIPYRLSDILKNNYFLAQNGEEEGRDRERHRVSVLSD